MGNLTPGSMFGHLLDVIKGPDKMHRLDFSVAPLAGELIYEGGLCSLNSSGLLVAGCAVGATANRPMPIFALQSWNDFDANSDIGNISGGTMSGLVAIGGFEISTTEFDSTASYAPNDLLKPGLTDKLGKVVKATTVPYAAEPVVGCVSKGKATNVDGASMLSFWTMFLPANTP